MNAHDNWPASANYSACELGIKLRVFIEDGEVIPVVEDDGSADTVRDLETAIGHLGRTLILAQFSIEQRVRSEGMNIYACFVSVPVSEVVCSVYILSVFNVYRD